MRALIASICLALLPALPAAAETGTAIVAHQLSESGATRFVSSPLAPAKSEPPSAYGPFRVLDAQTVALVGATDESSLAAFADMLRDHPGLATLAFIECPGTYDDLANLALGRMIRAAGLAAWVPEDGSVRSGAVELVLAGTTLKIEDGAQFAVHAWLDEAGYQASDYAIDSAENRRYLSYYGEMGMSAQDALAFYAMTNSVPFEEARWLDGPEMRRWVGGAQVAPPAELPPELPAEPQAEPRPGPQLAYLDLGDLLY